MNYPTGTVTFLFTDIEGSTQLTQQHPDAMPAALARHHAILREAIATQHGYVFRTIGDEFNVAFETAPDALAAALAARRALWTEVWGETGPLRVRMGLHTGLATPRNGDYDGYLTLSHTKRLMSIAYGGQILLSRASEVLLRDQLPHDVSLRDLGEHRLKDFNRAEHIFQVVAPDLPADFPPLNTLSALRNNLPMLLTSFIGRERELAEVKQLLSNSRLLTLTGPGGTGKTRLALQLAADVLEEFTDGVWLVELAPLADPSLVAQTIATTLGVHEQPRRSILDALLDYMHAKNLLLILDNCEHLIETCAQLADTLLRAAQGLKILASSREPLGIGGETSYRVPSLPLPDVQAVTLDAVSQNECVRLFMDRATAVQSHFTLTDRNASAIAQICHRLDGIPLAIELAAARVVVFSPEQITSRLDDRFKLLTGGSRTALERHQTLRALIDWSYDLLSEDERWLFRQLSVFAGGWTIEAAQALCPDLDVLTLLTQLVNKSLVMVEVEAEGTRYRLPETIRQYARDKLYEAGESEQARDRHLDFFLHFAEEAEPKLRSGEQLVWLNRVEIEHDNVRTALAWSLESGKSERALQLAGGLSYFWQLRGYLSEGQRWLEDALALVEREQSKKVAAGNYSPTHEEKAHRAKALTTVGPFHLATMNLKRARMLAEEGLSLWRELGDKWWLAVALHNVGLLLYFEGDAQTGLVRLEEGVSLAREVEDPWPLVLCLIRLGDVLRLTDAAAARRILEEGVAVARRAGDKAVLSEGLRKLGSLYYLEGDLTTAAQVTEEALAEGRAIGSLYSVVLALLQLVVISSLQNDPAKAKGYSLELWALGKETGALFGVGFALIAFGLVAIFGGEPERGVRLLAALEVFFRQHGMKPSGSDPLMLVLGQALAKAQAQLGPAAFEAAQQEGRTLTPEQAIALATEQSTD